MNKDNSTKIFIGFLAVAVLVLGAGYFMKSGTNILGQGSFSGTGTHSAVKVGLNASVSSTVASVNGARNGILVCNFGIGLVTVCLTSNCTYGSGYLLATTTPNVCLPDVVTENYKGAVTAVVSATTSPSVTSTLGVIEW